MNVSLKSAVVESSLKLLFLFEILPNHFQETREKGAHSINQMELATVQCMVTVPFPHYSTIYCVSLTIASKLPLVY